MESGKATIAPDSFRAETRDDTLVRTFEQVRATFGTGSEQIVDARAAARFSGEDPGPRPDLPARPHSRQPQRAFQRRPRR